MTRTVIAAATALGLALGAVALASPGPHRAGDNATHPKAADARPTRGVPQAVDTVRAARHPTLRATKALPKLARARLAALPDGAPPVLLPDAADLLATARVVTGPRWYTVFMEAATFSVYVAGSSVAIDAPTLDVPPAARARDWEPRISRSHGIVTVGFAAFGAAYDVDIECLGGDEHPMCGDDLMALELVRALRRLTP